MKWVLYIYTLTASGPEVNAKPLEFPSLALCDDMRLMVEKQAYIDGVADTTRTECVAKD